MTDLFGALYGTGAANYQASQDAASAKSEARSAGDDVRRLTERVEQLTLLCAAMWQLLRERTNLSEQDLAERVASIDAKDGVADGKLTKTVKKCPKCNRTMSPKYSRCLYCGYNLPPESLFEMV